MQVFKSKRSFHKQGCKIWHLNFDANFDTKCYIPTRQDYKNSQIKRSIMGKPERTPRGIICKQRKGEGHRLEATKRKFKQFKLNCFRSASDVTSDVRFVTISGLDIGTK